MRIGNVLESSMLFFMSFPSGVLYNKLMNTMNGITGDVTSPYLIAPSSVAPKEAPSPPNEVPSPRNMVPLLNLSQQLGATNAYLKATEFLWGDENWGDSARRRRHYNWWKVISRYYNPLKFFILWMVVVPFKVAFSTSSFLEKWKLCGEVIRSCCSLEKPLFFISSITQILLWKLQWWISGDRSGMITLMTKFLRSCCWQMLKTFLGSMAT